ncbi:MAG: type I DNA topoisomerase [Flavobacteriales bacterium]|tara:strand:+ start:35339 stop:37645 length:2307 start_codon:yes stop_codon:yes gene_type:complete
MAKNLVIVESPAKAKTIEGFLGKDFIVKSSIGHIRDLPKKGGMAIDVDNGFEPRYEITPDKKAVVSELKKLSDKSETVWLATDEDREGEAIAWHLIEALKLDESKIKRIVFNEITKAAITKAVDNPRELDIQLVNAQQARRVLDRLVGFELSPVLWRKVKQGLSAGRVQSVAVRLIVERENEIRGFLASSDYKIVAEFYSKDKKIFKAELPKRFKTKEEAKDFLTVCSKSEFHISSMQKKPAKKSPAAPFTTSTLQQEASRKLGFSVGQTMSVAQKLYEAGKITYMRTDSMNLSDTAVKAAGEQISKLYGEEYAQVRKYTTKSKGAQEAHEAIRPTDLAHATVEGERNNQRLYDLIWKRTISSQMADAQLERTTAEIIVSESEHKLVAKGEMIKFEGFLKVYLEGVDEEGEEQSGMLPKLEEGDQLSRKVITATERFSKPKARFTEASLVKKLEELGIGRPSTYAATITTVQNRGYVEKGQSEGVERAYSVLTLDDSQIEEVSKKEKSGSDKSKMLPTDIGIVVTNFLLENFEGVMDYSFTADVEKEFDLIANGEKKWNDMIGQFYGPFVAKVNDVIDNSESAKGQRLLGKDPKTDENVYVRIGRFGPMAQIGEGSEEVKPRFASLLSTQSITDITLEEALELYKLPRTVGVFEEEDVVAAIGRFGPYLRHKGKFVSIKKDDGDEPMTIEIDRSIELILAHRKAEAEKTINRFEGTPLVQVLNGRYGPFIQIGEGARKNKKNVKIPKGTDPKSLSREDCLTLGEAQKK